MNRFEVFPIDRFIARTGVRTQTRALATDEAARKKFRRYWRRFGGGIVLIRWLVLPAIRRRSERQYRATRRDKRS